MLVLDITKRKGTGSTRTTLLPAAPTPTTPTTPAATPQECNAFDASNAGVARRGGQGRHGHRPLPGDPKPCWWRPAQMGPGQATGPYIAGVNDSPWKWMCVAQRRRRDEERLRLGMHVEGGVWCDAEPINDNVALPVGEGFRYEEVGDCTNCAVCLGSLDDVVDDAQQRQPQQSVAVTTCCKHTFHLACIVRTTLQSSARCPVCRQKLLYLPNHEMKPPYISDVAKRCAREGFARATRAQRPKPDSTDYSAAFLRIAAILEPGRRLQRERDALTRQGGTAVKRRRT